MAAGRSWEWPRRTGCTGGWCGKQSRARCLRSGSELSVGGRYVRERSEHLGLYERVVMVPQAYEWGVEAQVDWYEAVLVLGVKRKTVQCFAMASGAAFHCAYPRATQQAFLEAHELAFAYFGGVFRRRRYDNLTSAVKKILRGYRREDGGDGHADVGQFGRDFRYGVRGRPF